MALSKFVRKNYPILLILPALLTTLFLVIYPLVISLRVSAYNWTFGKRWETASYVGLDNYIWMFSGGDYFLGTSIRVTLLYVSCTVLLSLALGMGIALLLNRVTRYSSIFTSAFIIPLVTMPAVAGLAWRLYFTYDGFVNYLLSFIGLKINWYSVNYALFAMVIATIWVSAPFFVLVLYAGLTSLPHEPYEAAKIDGASAWLIFKDITLPLMKPVILTATIIETINMFRGFDIPYVMFGGGPGSSTEILSIHISRVAFSMRYLGRGSCLSLLLIAIVLTVTVLLIRSLVRTRRGE